MKKKKNWIVNERIFRSVHTRRVDGCYHSKFIELESDMEFLLKSKPLVINDSFNSLSGFYLNSPICSIFIADLVVSASLELPIYASNWRLLMQTEIQQICIKPPILFGYLNAFMRGWVKKKLSQERSKLMRLMKPWINATPIFQKPIPKIGWIFSNYLQCHYDANLPANLRLSFHMSKLCNRE